jgi:outer membrane protein assembly factor BamD
MTQRVRPLLHRFVLAAAIAAVAVPGAGCLGFGKKSTLPKPGSVEADKFLFDRGMELLKNKKWNASREYFLKLIDTYPTSQYRYDAKLGIGDAYLGEGRIDTYILAANEFREFLTYYPVARRVDYAQYKLAVALSKQTLSAQRDQTATHDALREIETFLKTYTNSPLRPEVQKLHRQTRDLLSESEFAPGLHYYRVKWYPGAIDRFQGLLKDDPEFTNRDKVYFYLADSLYKVGAKPEAQLYFEKLLTDAPKSKHADQARKRLALIKR